MGNEESSASVHPTNDDWSSENLLENSNYLKYYNAIDKHSITVQMIEDVFNKYTQNVWLKFDTYKTYISYTYIHVCIQRNKKKNKKKETLNTKHKARRYKTHTKKKEIDLRNYRKYETLQTVEEKSVYIYSLQKGLMYQKINMALKTDNEKELKELMPLICSINKYITTNSNVENTQQITVFRGAELGDDYLKCFIPNNVVRILPFWDFSTNKHVWVHLYSLFFSYFLLVFCFGSWDTIFFFFAQFRKTKNRQCDIY